jgi:serine/threonine-protein kinase
MNHRLGTALAGRYDIDREIGRGGMATVYLARDVRHNRKVALKVLNPELGAVLGVERFLAEIEVTANLQHPNLLPLFDSGEADGMLFYVMPFIEGESLRKRLDREKQLPVDEAVRITTAIAGALDYAHRHKVIHRDLKPENILMQEGQPLIADFGIALAVSKAGGERITQTGLSLGTPQYMSPEQATGDRVVDGRTDIYSLGAMLYEMLVGDPPHAASTSQAIIAKVLTEKPSSVRISRSSVPLHVDAAVGRALEKLAADRFGSAKEFADALEVRATHVSSAYAAPTPAIRAAAPVRETVAWALVAVLSGAAAWAFLRPDPVTDAPVIRANFDLPPNVRINDVLTGPTVALSPDGSTIAFTSISTAGFRMYVRRADEIAARPLTDGNVAGRNLTFSPNGRWLAFTEGNVLKKVPVDGGSVANIGQTGAAVPYGISWADNDTIYVGGFTGLWAVPAGGGEPRNIGGTDSVSNRLGRRWPLVLPGSRKIVYASGNSTAGIPRLSVIDVATGESEEFAQALAMPLGLIDDQFVYVSPTGGLMAVRFDRSASRPEGDPVQLDEGVLVDPTAGVKASLSASGTLVYLKGRAQFVPVLVGANGASSLVLREPGVYSNPRFSPDGRKIAVSVTNAGALDIYLYDLVRNTFTRLTTEGANVRPEWTPDSRRVVFIRERDGRGEIWWQPADGSGPAEQLYRPEVEPFEAIVSPDSKWLVVRTAPGARLSRDILAVRLDSTRAATTLVSSPYTESMPRLSPNGKWLAFQSNETDRFEIYVRPFPGSGARDQVSTNGGTEPIWGRDGRSLCFRGPLAEIIRVRITTEPDFSIETREEVASGDYLTDSSHPNWDVAPDGRFLLLRRAGEDAQTIIVHNWAHELRAKTSRR